MVSLNVLKGLWAFETIREIRLYHYGLLRMRTAEVIDTHQDIQSVERFRNDADIW